MRGHIRRRGKVWYAYWYEDGRQRATSKDLDTGQKFTTRSLAEAWLAKRITELEFGIAVAPHDLTVGEYLDLWLERLRGKAHNTAKTYRSLVKNQIKPGLGSVRLQQLTTVAIIAWIGDMEADGLAPATTRKAYRLLRQSLADAADDQLIRRNPADSRSISLPKNDAAKDNHWNEDEVRVFLAVADTDPWGTFFRFLLASQLRMGEAMGLRWPQVDLAGGSIRVIEQYVYTARMLQPVKTAKAIRNVRLDDATIAALAAQRDRQRFEKRALPLGGRDDLVFTNGEGGFLTPAGIRKALNRLCRIAGVRRITPHGLRHTGATLLLRGGVPLHVVSRRLGHASIATTGDIYAHVLPSQEADAADRLGSILDSATG